LSHPIDSTAKAPTFAHLVANPWRSMDLPEPVLQPVEPKSCPESVASGRLDGLQAELRAAVNRLNEHIDFFKKKRGTY